MSAPIALFVYSRLDHTRRTIESVLSNPEAASTDLIIFSDAAKTRDEEVSVSIVRSYLKQISGFRSVVIHERQLNLGLAKSLTSGITQILNEFESAVILEDDLVVSPFFLRYINEGLQKYADDDRVISIHGYTYPVPEPLPETFFLRGADCWGWGTWRRAWKLFNPDGRFLLAELERRNLIDAFNLNGAYGFSEMLQGQIDGRNDSWAVRWHASAFLAERLTLYPGRSLVHNIGNDGSGIHCGVTTALDAKMSARPIQLEDAPIKPSREAELAIEKFHRNNSSKINRLVSILLGKRRKRFISNVARDFLPPVIIQKLRMFTGRTIRFEGPVSSWKEASEQSSGYGTQVILDRVLTATLAVKNGAAVYERDSVLFDEIEYSWPVTASLMYAAARNQGYLNVLDFGGSLGSAYYQNRQFLKGLAELHWSIVEQSHFVEAGREYFQDSRLRFYKCIEECLDKNKPNVILISSVLQYLAEPYNLLSRLLKISAPLVIIDRTPFLNTVGSDLVYVQVTPASIYSSTYPVWFFNKDTILNIATVHGYKRFAEFDTVDCLDRRATWKGLIFEIR